MSERVSWETCPLCGGRAAVGWADGSPVEFDCPAGCEVTYSELTRIFDAGCRRINGHG
jgi:hypothetical protein